MQKLDNISSMQSIHSSLTSRNGVTTWTNAMVICDRGVLIPDGVYIYFALTRMFVTFEDDGTTILFSGVTCVN